MNISSKSLDTLSFLSGTTSELYLLFVLLLILYYFGFPRKNAKIPNGPFGVPFFGNMFQMVQNPYLKMSEWAYKYGSIYTISAASKKILVISDVTSMKEILGLPAATGKFKTDTILMLSRGLYGLFNTEGSDWAEQRTFCLRSLVEFGFGNKMLENSIVAEAQDLVDLIKNETADDPDAGIKLHHYMKSAANNTLMSMLTGERVELEHCKNLTKIHNRFIDSIQRSAKTGLMYISALKQIAPELSGYNELDNCSLEMHKFWIEHINRHKETRVAGHPRDLIDAYLDKLEETQDKSSSFYGEFGWKNSLASIVELFEAGNETTSSTLSWLMYHMACHPLIQGKAQWELDTILGSNDPTLNDRARLPYTEAVILETLRHCPVAPMGIPHEFIEDCEYQNYRFPKGMLIFANIWHCHHDKQVWGPNADEFRPERFLGKGSEGKRELLVSFQPGKRSCLGEPMAKDIMFLFAAKLLKEFSIEKVKGISTEDYMDPDLAIAYLPKVRNIAMKPRRRRFSIF